MANIDEVNQDQTGPKKPSIATVKSVLDRSKESKQFSQYKKKEKPLEIKAASEPTFIPPSPDPLSIIGAKSKPYETNVKTDVIPSTATISKEFKTNPLQDQTWKFDEMTHKFTEQVPISVQDAVSKTVEQAYSGRFQPTLKKDDFAKDLTIKVQNGDYIIKDGIVRKKDEGSIEASLNAYADMFTKTSEAKDYFIMPRDKKKEYLMNWYRNLPTQVQPEVEHENAKMVGSMGAQITTTMAATGAVAVGAAASGLSGGTLAPVLMPVASSLLTSAYNTIGTELDYEKQTFKNAMDKGLDTDISFNAVEGGRPTYLTTTFVENAALNYAGIRAQSALTGLQKESGNTLLKYLKNIGTVRVPEAVGSAGVSGGMEYLRSDKMKSVTGADIDPSKQAKDVFYQGLYLQGMFNGIGALWGSTKILANKAIKSAILNHAANQDATFVDNMLKQYRQQGQLTEEQYVMFNKDLADFKAAKKANPDVNSGKVPEPKVPAVVGLGIKKKNLQAAAQTADGSARAELEARIQDVDERIKRAIAGMDDGLEGEIDDITMNPVNKQSTPSGTKKFIVDGKEVTEDEFNKATGNKQIINEDATTTTQEQQQAGQATGDISKYQGAEGEQAPPTNEADNSNRPISGEKKKVIPDSFDSRQGIAEIDAMDGIISRMNYDVGSKKLWRQNVSEAILKHLQKSELYNQADDIAREQMYRDAQKYFFNKQFKSAPSADKILGQVAESFTTNDKAAFKSLFKTTKNTIEWVNRTRDEIKTGLQELSKRGKIKASALTSVLNKYSTLDFSNDIAINKFVDHVSNIINVADYDTKISQAQKLRASISRMAKSKDAQGNLTKAAREFAKIDPENVSDLEIYMAKANEVSNGITPNRKKSQVFNIDDVSKYIDNEKVALSEKMKSQKMADYQDLVDKGILTTDMSLQDIEFIVKSIDEGADPSTIDANKMKAVQDYNKVKFPGLAAIAKSILGTGDDGFGNKIEVNMSPEDKVLLQDVLKVGIKNMSPKNAFKVNSALENFIVNGEHYGLEKVLREHYGERAGAYAEQAKIKAKPFNSYENIAYNLVGSLPQTFSNYFAGNTIKIQTSSGFTGFKSAAATADEMTSQMIKEFHTKFKNVKPNGLHLLDENNLAEQGLYSHMIRNSGGTPEELAAHFKDRKGLIEQSISNLKASREKHLVKLGGLYEGVYNKLLSGVEDIDGLNARMDKNNIDIVNHFVGKWADQYEPMNSFSKNYYGKELRKDNNFTPDIYKKTAGSFGQVPDDIFMDGNLSNGSYFPQKATGRFQEQVGPTKLADDSYISLDFLHDTKQSYRGAMVDLHGSKYIAQMNAFFKSNGFKGMFEQASDQKLLESKVKTYANTVRGNYNSDIPISAKNQTSQAINRLSTVATAATIGSFRNFFQQLAPIANAYGYTGKLNSYEANHNPHITRLINSSNRDIARTSIVADVSAHEIETFMKSYNDNPGAIVNFITNMSSRYLNNLVGKTDGYARRSSFWSYYLHNLEERGVKTREIDWANVDKLDDVAADHAQDMIDRTQNVVQADLKGAMLSSKDPGISMTKSMLFPLSDFMLNQKLGFWNNINKIYSSTTSVQDKINATRGTIAILSEAMAYNAIKHSVNSGYQYVADNISGYTPSDREKELRERNAISSGVSNFLGDLAAVPPQLNPLIIGGVNTVYDKVFNKDIPNELKIEFKDLSENSTNSYRGLGLLGIPIDNAGKAVESIKSSVNGVIESNNPKYPDDKYITPDAKKVMGLAGGVQIISQMGLLPSDFNQIANRVSSDISKKSMAESKFNLFDMLNKRGKNLKNANLNVVNGKNIMESFAYSYEIKDPVVKAEYMKKLINDYGQEEYSLLVADIADSKYDMKTKDYAMLIAAKTDDKVALNIASCLGYKDDDTQVYTLFQERQKTNPGEFYRGLTYMIKSGVVPMSTLVKYGEYIQGMMKDPSIDIQLLAKAGYEGGIKASSLDKK